VGPEREIQVIRVTGRVLLTIVVALFGLKAGAQTGTFVEWAVPTPNALPLHVVPASSSLFFFTESNKDRVAELNTSTNLFTEWLLPPGAVPHGIVLPSSDTIAFCAYSGNYIGVFDTSTSELTAWEVPTADAGPIHLDISGSTFFFTEALGNKIAWLDPGTSQVTEWLIPTPASTPRGIAVGLNGEVFVAEMGTNKIAMLNTTTNNITEWTLPSVRQVEHLRYYQGVVYFGDLGSSVIGALIPSTNTVIYGPTPTSDSANAEVFISSGLINFTERNGNKIGLFNPSLQQGLSKKAVPVVTPVVPAVSAVTSTPYTLTPDPTTVPPPTTTNVAGVKTGGFTEWTIPTAASGPLGISVIGNTTVFTEYNADKIATLTVANGAGKH
jgi:virginiamycin B lyase